MVSEAADNAKKKPGAGQGSAENGHENDKTHGPEKTGSSNLSEQATKPGDLSTLAIIRGLSGHLGKPTQHDGRTAENSPGSAGGSPASHSKAGETTAAKAVLDHDALVKKVESIHEALHKRALFGVGWSSPDSDRIFRELEPLNQTDRRNLEKLYGEMYGGKEQNFYELRKELRERLGAEADSRAMAILNRKDGVTNDAGQIKTLLVKLDVAAKKQADNNSWSFLHVASDVILPAKFLYERYENSNLDGERAGAEKQLRETIAGLNSKQMLEIKKEAILRDRNLSPETREALNIYLKNADPSQNGIDKRTAQDQLDLANIAVKYKNIDMLGEALRGDSPAAVEARKRFAAENGDQKLQAAFSEDDLVHARDFLKGGRISLATVVKEDTAHWYHHNKDDLKQALTNASDAERNDFTKGRELAIAGKRPTNDDERRQLEFYNNLHKTLKEAASDTRELVIFEDKILRKGSLVSQVAETHSDGWWITGIGKGHDTGDLLTKIENMSEEDWNRLKTDPTFKRDVTYALKTFASDDERRRAEDLLARKAESETYAKASDEKRSILSTIGDNTHQGWFGSTNYDSGKILDSISRLSTADQKSYHDNPQFKKQLDDQVNAALNDGPEKALAQRLLAKVAAGQELKLDAIDRVMMDTVKGAKSDQTVRDIEAAFKENPGLLARIQNPANQEDKDLKQYMERALVSAVYKSGMPPEACGPMYDRYAAVLFQAGALPLAMKLELNDNKKASLEEIVNASETDRKRLTNPVTKEDREFQKRVFNHLSDDERKVAENGLKQGSLSLADRIRAFTLDDGSTYHDLREALQKMRNNPEQIQSMKNEYTKKYGRSLDDDLLSRVDEKDQITYKNLLTPAKMDGRQVFYDQLAEHMSSRSGIADSLIAAGYWDGSRTALDRALNQNAAIRGEYARKFEDLPPEKQQQLIDMYAQAIQTFRDSKGQMSQQLVDAALVVGSLAAAPLSGGASLTAIVALASAGAAFKIAATAALEGNDFKDNPKHLAKLALEGAFTTGLAVVGPAQFASVFKVGDAAAAQAVAGLGARLVPGAIRGVEGAVLREGYELAGKKALATMTREALVSGRDLTAAQFAKVAEGLVKSEITGQARREAVQEITKQLATHYNVALEQGKRTLVQNILQGGRQLGTEAVSNAIVGGTSTAASQIVAFPLDYDPRLGLSANLAALGERMKMAGVSGAAGGALFTGLFHVAKPVVGGAYRGFRSLLPKGAPQSEGVAIAFAIKEGEHVIAANGRNPNVEITHANGQKTTVRSGQEYRLQPGDEITGIQHVEGRRGRAAGGDANNQEIASIATDLDDPVMTRVRVPEEKIYVPERDFTKLTPQERLAIVEPLRDGITGLAQNNPIDTFVARNLEMTAGWTDDLAAMELRLKELREPYEQAVHRYQSQVVDELMGRIPYNDILERGPVTQFYRSLVEAGEITEAEFARKIKIYDDMARFRDPYAELSLKVNDGLEQRRLQIQEMINKFADEQGLPRTKVHLQEDMGSAQAKYQDGEIYLRKDAVADTHNVSQMISSAYHEFVHHEQDNLMIRMMIDHVERSIGRKLTTLGPAEIERIQVMYNGMVEGGVSKEHLEAVFAARKGRVLNADEVARATKMVEAFKNNSPVGNTFIETGNHFRIAKREYRMLTDPEDPNGAFKLVGKLGADKKTGVLSEHLFGTKTLPPEIDRLVTIHKKFMRGDDIDFPKKDAEKLLNDMLRSRMRDLNDTRRIAYEKYMAGVHEKEAWLVGERARLRAKDAGASSGKKKVDNDIPFEVDEEPRFLDLRRDGPDQLRTGRSGAMESLRIGTDTVGDAIDDIGLAKVNRLRDYTAAVQDYNRALVRQLDKAGGKSGDAYQIDMFGIIRSQLRELQSNGAVGPEWELFPTAIGSGADRVGADFMLVNNKTGEFHLLDPTSNLEKRNVAAIRADGVIYYEPRWIDRMGALKLDPGEPVDIRNAVGDFQTTLSGQLRTLTERPSLLNLNDTPFPSAFPTKEPASMQEGVDRFVTWLKLRANEYLPESTERALLEDYALVLQRGAQKHGQIMAAKQPATPVFRDAVQRASDVTVADLAAKQVLGFRLEKPPSGGKSNIMINKQGEINFKPSADVIYDAGSAKDILQSSRNRLFDLKELANAIPRGRMKALRAQFPGSSDQQILEKVRNALQDSSRLIGTRTKDDYYPFIDDLAARLRQRDADDLLRPKPASTPETAIDSPELPRPAAQPQRTVTLETVTTTTNDLKSYWSIMNGEAPLSPDTVTDVLPVMEMLLDDRIATGTWNEAQIEWFQDLMAAFTRGDRDALTMVDNILR